MFIRRFPLRTRNPKTIKTTPIQLSNLRLFLEWRKICFKNYIQGEAISPAQYLRNFLAKKLPLYAPSTKGVPNIAEIFEQKTFGDIAPSPVIGFKILQKINKNCRIENSFLEKWQIRRSQDKSLLSILRAEAFFFNFNLINKVSVTILKFTE